ncbi:hypothetical protein K7432_000010 [Basidiobolus ranarum]|uniref:Uncharacterized protein n=1 Tax=Basidiobolus ranarum TaxID=34480 RepID=A0ABR2WBY4_9FUNG
MLSNPNHIRVSNAGKNWRTALFLISQLALSNTILGEEATEDEGTSLLKQKKFLEKKDIQHEVEDSDKDNDDTPEFEGGESHDGQKIIRVTSKTSGGKFLNGRNELSRSFQVVGNNHSNLNRARVSQNSRSFRLISSRPASIIEQVYLTAAPEEQIVLFPDNQLRFLGGIQNWYEGDFGLNRLGLSYGYDQDDSESVEQVVVLPETHQKIENGKAPLSTHKNEEFYQEEFTRIEEKLDHLIEEVALGHKSSSASSYHFGKGSNKELDVLSGKVEELIRTVGGISTQNVAIEELASKTYSNSAKTISEVNTLNEKLERLRRGVSQLSEEQQHSTQEQNIAIVKSSKDITEINARLTDLLRAVGRLSKDGSYTVDSGYTDSGKNNGERDYELQEIRNSIRGLHSAMNLITKEVSNAVSRITKISSKDNESIIHLRKELTQVRNLLESSIEQDSISGKQEMKAISEVLANQNSNFKDLFGRVGRLVESLNTVAQEVHDGNVAEGEHSESIYKEIKGLKGRLNEAFSSLTSLVEKESTLISEHHSNGNYDFNGKNVKIITSEIESLRELIKNITSQQLRVVEDGYGNKKEGATLEYSGIVNLLNRIQKACEELTDGQQKILSKHEHEHNRIPAEFLRDINGITRAIMMLKSVTETLFKEQTELIKSKLAYSDKKWSAFNSKLSKLDKILQSLAEQSRWIQQQSNLIAKMDGNLVNLGKKIEYLIEEQEKLRDFKHTDSGKSNHGVHGKVVISLDNLRNTIQELVESQKILIKQYKNPSTSKEITKDIGSINYRLADISNIVERLVQEQMELTKYYRSDISDKDGISSKSVDSLNSRINQLVEVVELISRQQKILIKGKPVNIDLSSIKGNFEGLNNRLGKLSERVDFIIKQQESIFDRLSKDQSEEYKDLRGILEKLRVSVKGIFNQRKVVYENGEGEGMSGKFEKEISTLEGLTSKIYRVIEKVAVDQRKILNNENGQSQDINKINGKLSQLSDVMALVLKQQKRFLNGGFAIPDYSKDVGKLNEQLRILRDSTVKMIQLQEESLKNSEYSSNGDLGKLGKQLSIIKQTISQLYSGQEKLLGVVAKEETSQKILEDEARLAQRIEQLTYLVNKLAEDQINLLGGFKKGSGKIDLSGLIGRLGKFDEIIKILNTQQSYTLRLLELAPIIQEEAADIKKINGQMQSLRSLLGELSALQKDDLATDKETLQYVKQTSGRLSKIYGNIERMFNSQKEILRYLENGSSVKGIDDVRQMSKKILMLTEATNIVLSEVKSSLSQVEGTTKYIAKNTQQINSKIDQLNSVMEDVSKKQDVLLRQVSQLSKSQDKNFRIVNQRLNTLGKDINQLSIQQKELLEKYGNDVEKLFGITDAKLAELRKSIELMVSEQRKLAYYISESKGIKSKEVLEELSKLDGGMDQLTKFVRGLLEQQNKLLAYTQEDNAMIKEHGKELRMFGDQMNKLYSLVARVLETQKHLITREEVVELFKQQKGDIKGLALELAEISNHIVQLLNQQKTLLEHEKGDSEELNLLRKVLSQVSESVRKVLVQQNVLLQSGWDKVPKELLNDIESLRSQFGELNKAVMQISNRQNYLIQQEGGNTKRILDDIGQVKQNLAGLSQLVEKIAQFQLNIIKRGGLTPEQAQDLKNIKSELRVLDNKVASLVEQQQQLIAVLSKDGQMDNGKIARIAQSLAELRKTAYNLISQQTNILSQKFDEALEQKIPAEIARLNSKLVGLHKEVDHLLGLQKELLVQSRKDSRLIVEKVDNLDAKLGQLGSYIKELSAEQKAILLNNSDLLKQNLGKTDRLTYEVKNLDKKIENLVRIQYELLKRIDGESKLDAKETKRILQGLSGLQSLISQLIVQQEKLISASLTGKVSEPILRKLELLNEKYAQLVEIVSQITTKQNALFQLSRDSNNTEHRLEEQVDEINKRLLGLFDFIKQTFAEQTKVLNTREITALLRDQSQRITNLGVKLSELGNQFDKMVNEQGFIIKQLGEASSNDTKRDRAISQELMTLREVIRKLIESQRSLLGPEIAAKVGEEVSKIISSLNDRMVQLGVVIQNVRKEQTEIVKFLREGGNYKQVEGQLVQLRRQFSQITEWIKKIATEQSQLLRRDEVMSILKEQTGDIRLIKSRLSQFKNDIVRIVEIQGALLRETKTANDGDIARDTELAKRLSELKNLTETIVNIQQVILNSDTYKIIPKEILSQVNEINARLERFGPTIFKLLDQQKYLLELTSVEKRDLDEIRGEVNGISTRVIQLLKEIKQIHEEQRIIISQNQEVKAALDQQLGYIQNINSRLSNFAARTTEFLSQQAKLLEKVLSTQERDEHGLGETLGRVKQLQGVVASILHWQQSLNLPEILGSLPKTLVNTIRELSEKIIHLTDNVANLGQQQHIIVEKQNGEFESIRQGLGALNGRIGQFGDILQEISSVQAKLIHDDRVLALLNHQSNQIQGLGININTIRKEITQLINQQQQLLNQGSGIHQGEIINLKKIGGNISYLTKVVDQLFKQQQLLANSQLLNQFPKRIVNDVEILNKQVQGLGESVKEIRELQAVFLKSQNRNNQITGNLARNVEVISGKFNNLSESVRRILELQQAILNNDKVGPILEKFYGEFRGIDGRLSRLSGLVSHILDSQQTLVNTKQFQTFVHENRIDDRKIFETLSSLRNTLRVLFDQQKDLVRPEMLNAVAKNLHRTIRAVGGQVTGLGAVIERIQEEQKAVLENQGRLNVNFEERVNGLNQQLSTLNESVHRIFAQQGEILRNEQVLKVIAERLSDLEPIKHNLSGVNERLNALLHRQNDITQIVEKAFGQGTEISRQIIGRFAEFSQSAPKELLGQIVGLNRQFEIINSGIGKLFEIQKEILSHEHRGLPNENILNRLYLLTQHFDELSTVAKYIAKKQNDLMNREELLTILRQQSGAIHGVDVRVGQLGERVNSLIGQQRTLLGTIVQKLDKSGYSRDRFDAVLARLAGLEKGIQLVLRKQQNLAALEVEQGNRLDGKIQDSTRFLNEKLTRLTQVVDRLFEEQKALIAIERENTEISKATLDGVERLNNNLVHLDDAVQFLVKEAQQIDAKVTTLLGLPQDVHQVKVRLERLSDSTKRLIEQHARLFEFTKGGVTTLNRQGHALSENMNIRLSEIAKLVNQLIHQQNQLLAVESRNSHKHSQEIESLASKIYKIEEVVEFLLSEQRKLFELNRSEQNEQFTRLDQKLNLFGDALKQLISQQHNLMRLTGLVEKQSIAINNMGGALGNLNGIVARLVSQQQELLVYTKEHDHAELAGLNDRLGELRNTVAKIINQHQVLLRREINDFRSQENKNDREITAHFDQRINQVSSLMVKLVREQDTILSHIKRQTLDNNRIAEAVSRISNQINELAQLTVRLNLEQNSLIERGFTQLSQQNNQGFKRLDNRLDIIGHALGRITGDDANSLINRFELASRQQSRENREIKSRLNQITKVLEKIVTRPELIFPNHARDFVDLKRRIGYLDQVLEKLTTIQTKSTEKLLSLDEEQRQKVDYLLNIIPTLNESIRRLGLLGATDSHRFFEELSTIRETMQQCDNAIISLKETLNLNGFLVGSLVSPDINIESLIKKGVYSKGYALDRSGFKGASKFNQKAFRKSWSNSDSDAYQDGQYDSESGAYGNISDSAYADSGSSYSDTSNKDLHDGYDFHNGYWYPENKDFNRAITSKYTSDEDSASESFNSISESINESLLQAEKTIAKSEPVQTKEEDEDDSGSGY